MQGWSVSISGSGNTAIVGGRSDSSGTGAAWVFVRSDSAWSQQGEKLVGADAIGNAEQGYSVSLSADGNTAIVGGYDDNSSCGATWVFARSGAAWAQKGDKLVGDGAARPALQGSSVALSADGSTAVVGGNLDNDGLGAAWVYVLKPEGIDEEIATLPRRFSLGQNYPNPFNPSTTVKYELPTSSTVKLSVFDMLGREVIVLVSERQEAGIHEVKFDASGLSSGMYFYRLQAGDFVQARKLLLVR
jgi:hypothetical protein